MSYELSSLRAACGEAIHKTESGLLRSARNDESNRIKLTILSIIKCFKV